MRAGGKHGLLARVSALALLVFLAPIDASAGEEAPAIGFSNLVFRPDAGDEIGVAKQDLRIHVLEALRDAHFHAVGAENLVFGTDHAEKADFLLGGTLNELICKKVQRTSTNCRVSIEWQLLDVHTDSVTYRVTTRHAEYGVDRLPPTKVGIRLVLGALREMMDRPRFRGALKRRPRDSEADAAYAPRTFKRCEAPDRTMPAQSEENRPRPLGRLVRQRFCPRSGRPRVDGCPRDRGGRSVDPDANRRHVPRADRPGGASPGRRAPVREDGQRGSDALSRHRELGCPLRQPPRQRREVVLCLALAKFDDEPEIRRPAPLSADLRAGRGRTQLLGGRAAPRGDARGGEQASGLSSTASARGCFIARRTPSP